MKKYFLLLTIITTSALNFSSNLKPKKFFYPSYRSYEQYPTGSMIPKTPEFEKFWQEFYSAKNEYMHYEYAQGNIAALKFVGHLTTILPSYLALSQFYSNESSINASTILATLNGAKEFYKYYQLKNRNHKRIINDCANNLNPEYLQKLKEYYEKKPNDYSEPILNKILQHPTMQKRIKRVNVIKKSREKTQHSQVPRA